MFINNLYWESISSNLQAQQCALDGQYLVNWVWNVHWSWADLIITRNEAFPQYAVGLNVHCLLIALQVLNHKRSRLALPNHKATHHYCIFQFCPQILSVTKVRHCYPVTADDLTLVHLLAFINVNNSSVSYWLILVSD